MILNKTPIIAVALASNALLLAQSPAPVKLTTAEYVFAPVDPGFYGAYPQIAATGDFNNDGIPDIVVVDDGNPAMIQSLPQGGPVCVLPKCSETC